MENKFSGGCLCGAVRYECHADPVASVHCHCNDCRKSSGTGHCSHMAVPTNSLEVSGKLSHYEKKADSGNTVGRSFCPACGSAIYSTNSSMTDLIFPRASSLDDIEFFKPQMSVYIKRAASWDQPDPALIHFDEMPTQAG